MRRIHLLALTLVLSGCTDDPFGGSARFVPTGRIGQALTETWNASATAFVVPVGEDPGETGQALVRGDDGRSFSGFLPADPGEYRLELVFRGQPPGATEPVFIGRWTSDILTVVAGQAATVRFSSPIDTIGRPEDGGDTDGDGLGLVDEYLWGANPALSDADGDGVVDGLDCSPGLATDSTTIAANGSIEDCDGDGIRRPDLPYGGIAGADCNDRDASINPGATDSCEDTVDQDCNPSTCPSEDQSPPTLDGLTPADGATVGCHASLLATVNDPGNVVSVRLEATALFPGSRSYDLYGTREAGTSQWALGPFNQLGQSSGDGLLDGPQMVTLVAVDGAGNELRAPLSFDFDFAVPPAPSFSPAQIGEASAPVSVELSATGYTLELFAAPRSQDQAYYLVDQATRIAGPSDDLLSTSVDPTGFADGQYLIYPVVSSGSGNRLQPNAVAAPVPTTAGPLEVSSDFGCARGASYPTLPVRVMTVDSSGVSSDTTWRPLLQAALDAAAAQNPNLQLGSLTGYGVDAEGRVNFGDATSYVKNWTFGFKDFGTGETFSVAWRTPLLTNANPVTRVDDGSLTIDDVPFANPATLPDSGTVLAAFAAQSSCVAPTGDEYDNIIYQVWDGEDRVLVPSSSGSGTWGASIDASGNLTEIFDCN